MEFAILTMSSKNGGYCVAGINLGNGQFVRLVLDENGAAIPKEYMYGLRPLDVIDIQIEKYVPVTCQTENVIVDWSTMRKLASISLEQVLDVHDLDTPQYLFEDNKRFLWEDVALNLNYSLLLVCVNQMKIHTEPGANHDKTQADFMYNGEQYLNISITDRDYYNQDQIIGTAVIVMSIPNKRMSEDNECYLKFIAKIF